jgi:uncharacterized protein (DUF983 family)
LNLLKRQREWHDIIVSTYVLYKNGQFLPINPKQYIYFDYQTLSCMPKFCPTCGKLLQFENADICPHCGVRIKSPTTINTIKKPDTGRNILLLIVVGIVILVLAVIVAAVIAAFVFDMSGNIAKTKIVAVSASQPDSNHIVIMNQGGQDANTLEQLTTTVTSSSGNSQTKNIGLSGQTSPIEVGSSVTFTGAFSGKDQVIVVGTFSDGAQQILLDTYV